MVVKTLSKISWVISNYLSVHVNISQHLIMFMTANDNIWLNMLYCPIKVDIIQMITLTVT